jgi:hypothetical protein
VTRTGASLAAALTLVSAAPAAGGTAPAHSGATTSAAPGVPTAPPDHITAVEVNPGLSARLKAATGNAQLQTLLAGTLMDDQGRPVAGVEVRVDLEPSRAVVHRQPKNVGAMSLQLARAATDSAGRFELRVPKLADPFEGFADQDGTVSLLVGSFGRTHSLLYHLRVRPPATDGAGWTWASVDAAVISPQASTIRRSAKVRTQGLRALRLTAHRNAPRAKRAGGIDVGEACSHNAWTWRKATGIGDLERRWVNVQRIHTDNQIRARYEWSNTSNLETDAAANLGAKGVLVSAGFVRSETVSAGVDFTLPAFGYQDAQVDFTFRPYHLQCMNPITGHWYYSGKFEWRPEIFTGGNRFAKPYSAIFPCGQYVTPIEQRLWVARTSSFTYANGVSLLGVTLRSRQTNSENHKLTYTASSPTWICGKDDWPTRASQVREK